MRMICGLMGVVISLLATRFVYADTVSEVRLGTDVPLTVWGERDTFSPPSVSAALALVHSATLAHDAGLNDSYDVNAFFATAIKESRLGMEYQDGPFQIESGTAFEEMKRIFPNTFSTLDHQTIIAGDAFETSALTKAYYDVFAVAMLDHFGYKAEGFMSNAQDPWATIKIISLAYNRGLWWEQFPVLFQAHRAHCVQVKNLLRCIDHDVAEDHAAAIARYTKRLKHPKQYGGKWYDPDISWLEIESYIDTIEPFIPEQRKKKLLKAVAEIFNERSNNSGMVSFRYDAQVIINTILTESRSIPDPTRRIDQWY